MRCPDPDPGLLRRLLRVLPWPRAKRLSRAPRALPVPRVWPIPRATRVLRNATIALATAACGGRAAPVPDLSGAVSDVIVHAALAGARAHAPAAGADGAAGPASRPLLLDSTAFGRLGAVVGDAAFSGDEVRRQVRREVTLVDADDVLVCPSREPCRVREGSTFVTVWDASLSRGLLSVVVSRAWNEDRLYTMTRHETFRLELRGAGDSWRLTGWNRLSP